MRSILLTLFFLLFTSCSSLEVFRVEKFTEKSKDDLIRQSATNFKDSGIRDYIPEKHERNDYFSSFENSMSYQNYLLTECVLLLHKEHGLDLDKNFYASIPKWNNVQNWYATIFNYQVFENQKPVETTMECDLAVNNKMEVSEYQIRKNFAKLNKN